MKQANMTIMANGPCLNLLKRTELGENFKLHDTFICVKGTIGKKMTFRVSLMFMYTLYIINHRIIMFI